MRSLRCNGLSLMAMLVLLLGTAAPALSRMTCVMGGASVMALGHATDCMPVDHSHTTTTIQATCCEVLQAQPQRADFVQSSNPVVPMLPAMVMPAPMGAFEAVSPVLRTDAWSSRPPPLPLPRRLAATGIFLI